MSNQLQFSTSSYLRQHADNPVQWYMWNDEALVRAREEKKPILLSIGYSACHWCHVMAAESFSDPAIGKVMNEHFINIKIDREERPDLDKVYQTAHQLLSQSSGGWPLTVFLTHDDHIPFFTGTYFPPKARYGLPSFGELLQEIIKIYAEQQTNIRAQNQQVQKFLQTLDKPLHATELVNDKPLANAQRMFVRRFDAVNGGFAGAPKFPQAIIFEYFLSISQQNNQISEHLRFTLKKMALGGIYDQLGGGFYRYSVDERWEIPHFEKMLYDNAQLLSVYSKAYGINPDPQWLVVIKGIIDWAVREMRSPEGGFYCAIDADSEHEEGKFYRWKRSEIQALLSAEEFAVMATCFNLNEAPNFEEYWHLYCKQLPDDVQSPLLLAAKQKLFKHREQRIRPQRDEKILTAWNALMIKGLATAYQYTQETAYLKLAEDTLNFIQTRLWKDNQLFACYANHAAYQTGFLDDYAYLLEAVLILLQQRWKKQDLLFAKQLADYLLHHFIAPEGGFYFTNDTQETLFYRPQYWQDDAIPAGNGIAAYELQRLGYLLGEPSYLLAAEKTLKAAWQALERHPSGHSSLLMVLTEYLAPPEIFIIRGDKAGIKIWQELALSRFAPHRLSYAIPNDEHILPAGLSAKTAQPQTTAYICAGRHCEKPVVSFDEFKNFIFRS